MKYKGKKLQRPNREVIAIPRGDGEDIIFIAEAVLDFEKFEKVCPPPKPGIKLVKGGQKVPDFESAQFKSESVLYAQKRYHYIVLESLRTSPGLEWETVDYGDPSTWINWEKELKDSGFSETEINLIIFGVSNANCLNQTKIDEARTRFLAGTEQDLLAQSCSLQQERHCTPSGEPVKIGESSPQELMQTAGKV